ncbi:hypothetical protein BKA57DRAFT_444766 [Linnemannia elongata]|nr:hypothetical protein BKA57DRAFT_444766 [Linnemannia elongata]
MQQWQEQQFNTEAVISPSVLNHPRLHLIPYPLPLLNTLTNTPVLLFFLCFYFNIIFIVCVCLIDLPFFSVCVCLCVFASLLGQSGLLFIFL